jgi:DNA-binding LacI/PurR family transcriptional regulator
MPVEKFESQQSLVDQSVHPSTHTSARRPSLKDIAHMLGISQTAVSFAINGRPGVSQQTRQRVNEVIKQLGWTPVYAARALGSSRTMTVGFAMSRAIDDYQTEAFTLHFLAGIHLSLADRGYSLLFKPCNSLSEEENIYRMWAKGKRVDGVVLTDLREHDPRPQLLAELKLPAVLAGGPDPSGLVPSLSIDDEQTMKTVLTHLCARGYRRIAYLAGDQNLAYCEKRVQAFHSFFQAHPVDATWTEFTGFAEEQSVRITQQLLSLPNPPDAFVFETDAIASICVRTIAAQLTPDHYPMVAPAAVSFEDSIVCKNSYPSITAVHRDAGQYGQKVANLLLKRLSGHHVSGNRNILTPTLIVRESTRTRIPPQIVSRETK